MADGAADMYNPFGPEPVSYKHTGGGQGNSALENC